ncbi:MAG: C-GCAxxG-C-C family protein [Bacteroidales bacterium]|jgi:C_GCAxxG_C_C family probable redox protein|nr:C-GCAxxG-C-C family protein [Bacteroidales bacterium]
MTTRKELASLSFKSGYNCAQAVLTSFSDFLDRNPKELLAVAAGFGGGMGKMQNTCGAVTGAFMVFSIYASGKAVDNSEAKILAEGLVREFDSKFKALKGTTSCREIIGIDMHTEEGMKTAAENNLFGTVCVDAVEAAVGIVEDLIL